MQSKVTLDERIFWNFLKCCDWRKCLRTDVLMKKQGSRYSTYLLKQVDKNERYPFYCLIYRNSHIFTDIRISLIWSYIAKIRSIDHWFGHFGHRYHVMSDGPCLLLNAIFTLFMRSELFYLNSQLFAQVHFLYRGFWLVFIMFCRNFWT